MRDAEATHKAKEQLQPLRFQANMRRMKTSQTIKDLVEYINKQYQNDRLIFPDRDNPFKPKKNCTIL